MANFDFLKQYIFNVDDPKRRAAKHTFFRLKEADILDAEKRIECKFPKELRDFYFQIGYGFMCTQNLNMIDRFMDCGSVADFLLGEGIYQNDPNLDEFNHDNMLVFFEVSEESFIYLDLAKEDDRGVCPVFYFDKRIANSIEEFIVKMNNKADYYLTIPDKNLG